MSRSNRAWSTALFVVAVPFLISAATQIDADDWPLYLVFLLLINAATPFVVEVLPGLGLCLPELAATLGFLYVGGAPIIVFHYVNSMLVTSLVTRWSGARSGQGGLMRRLSSLRDRDGIEYATAASTFALGLIVRWLVASSIAGPALPITDLRAILAGEISGYATWALLSVLPVYPGRGGSSSLLPLAVPSRLFRSAMVDMGLMSALTLTPFILLISYGYQAAGIPGAVAGSISALAPHFTLKRLIDRRRRVEEQNRTLEELNHELEQRERLSAIGKMSTIVSHQILQHLGIIGLHAHLIRNTDPDTVDSVALDKARDNAAAIEESLAGVNRVLQDLLIFSRDQRVNLYDHAVLRVLEECIEECRKEAAERRVALELSADPKITARFDKLKIAQAVVNLVRNAIQASPAGGRVTLSARVDGDDTLILVADEGPGVPESQREHIFVPFHSTKEEGSGLGLAIARIFVEAHGGAVAVHNRESGHGAIFTITLPGLRVDTTGPRAMGDATGDTRGDTTRATARGE